MRILDELGLSENDYTLPGSRADQFVVEFVNYFNAVIPCSVIQLERSYVRGLERAHFDHALWKHMESQAPYVTVRQGFAMTDVLKDSSGKVSGIVGKEAKGNEESFTADLVVGADGRFSTAAQKFGARIAEERNDYTTAGYETQWENVLPYIDRMSTEVSFYNTVRGFGVLFIPVAQGRYYVAAYMRSQDAQRGSQTPEEFYLKSLQRIPQVWKRLEGARMITELEGIKPVENGYREAFGRGWALTGDSFHYKDPLDGQGIYDALIETQYLAEAIADWKSGKLTWAQAGAQYKEKAWAATYPMFKMTTERVHREIHTFPPAFIIKTLIRWTLNDPAYQTTLMRVLARVVDPSELPTTPSLSMIWRGIRRSLQPNGKENANRQPSPAQ
jgi:flavin-dependent dehydrogenase